MPDAAQRRSVMAMRVEGTTMSSGSQIGGRTTELPRGRGAGRSEECRRRPRFTASESRVMVARWVGTQLVGACCLLKDIGDGGVRLEMGVRPRLHESLWLALNAGAWVG